MKTIFLLLALTPLLAGDTIYTITSLGALGGASSLGYGINATGAVVGWAETLVGSQQAFCSTNGAPLQTLPSPSASDSLAYGINGTGVIVGTTYVDGQAHGTVWTASGTTDLGAGIFALGINDAGAIVGSNGHAFRLVNGQFQDLGALPGGDWSAAYGINDAGTVVGYGDLPSGAFRGMVWDATGALTELGTLGGTNSYALGVNSSGEVVGHSGTPSGYEHAFVEIGGVMTDLGTLNGGSSFAYGINGQGTVVGYSWAEDEDNPRAFVYLGGVMLDLNSLLPAGSGWQLLEAYGINDSGDIVGSGFFNGQPNAFLLDPQPDPPGDPVPEPSTRAVICMLISLFAISPRLRCGPKPR